MPSTSVMENDLSMREARVGGDVLDAVVVGAGLAGIYQLSSPAAGWIECQVL